MNAEERKRQEESPVPTYTMTCDACGELYQSEEGFPAKQRCPKCEEQPAGGDWKRECGLDGPSEPDWRARAEKAEARIRELEYLLVAGEGEAAKRWEKLRAILRKEAKGFPAVRWAYDKMRELEAENSTKQEEADKETPTKSMVPISISSGLLCDPSGGDECELLYDGIACRHPGCPDEERTLTRFDSYKVERAPFCRKIVPMLENNELTGPNRRGHD